MQQSKKSIVVLLISIIILVTVFIIFFSNFIFICGKYYNKNSKELFLYHFMVDSEIPQSLIDPDLSSLKKFTKLEFLALFTAGNIDLYDLTELGNLKELYIDQACFVNNWEALSGLSQLERLWLANTRLKDLSYLRKLNNLKALYIARNPIDDISVVLNMPHLEVIDIYGTKVHDISPLLELENLKRVIVKEGQLKDEDIALLRENGIVVDVS